MWLASLIAGPVAKEWEWKGLLGHVFRVAPFTILTSLVFLEMAERPCNAEHLVRAARAPSADRLGILVFDKNQTPYINSDPRLTPGAPHLSSSQGLSRIDELIHLPAVNRPVETLPGAGGGRGDWQKRDFAPFGRVSLVYIFFNESFWACL